MIKNTEKNSSARPVNGFTIHVTDIRSQIREKCIMNMYVSVVVFDAGSLQNIPTGVSPIEV